jgi:hypothetical protein
MEDRTGRRGAWVLLLAFAVACGGKQQSEPSQVPTVGEVRVPAVDPSLCDTKGKRVETFDLNRDGKPDVWKLYQTIEEGGTKVEIMTCKQVDYDHDGKKDYVAIYGRSGELIAEDIDLNFDGHFDAREYYDKKTGKVHLVERVSEHGGKPNMWEEYDDSGALVSVRIDRNGDGKPDVWEQYDHGKLVAILYDDDFDNRVDRKEQRKVEAPRSTPTSSETFTESAENDGGARTGDAGGAKPEKAVDPSESPAPAAQSPDDAKNGAKTPGKSKKKKHAAKKEAAPADQ